jgi:hypothetical protein
LNNAKVELEKAIELQKTNKKKEKPRNKLPDFSIPNNRKLEDGIEGLDILA